MIPYLDFLIEMFHMPFIFYSSYTIHYLDNIYTVFSPLPEEGNFQLSVSLRAAHVVARDGRLRVIRRPLWFTQASVL